MSTPFTMLANLCWNPACSVPPGSRRRDFPSVCRYKAAATPTTWSSVWPACSSRPNPGPATPQWPGPHNSQTGLAGAARSAADQLADPSVTSTADSASGGGDVSIVSSP